MKISVIIPNYNNELFITKCLQSLEIQTFRNFEVIIIDDGSTDSSVDVINDYISKSNLDIKLICQENMNAANARNNGMKIAKGEYLFFLDSDDEIYSYTLETLFNEIENCDLAVGDCTIVSEFDEVIDEYITKDHIENKIDNTFKYSFITPMLPNKLYKVELVKKYNIKFGNVKIGQDNNFFLKYLAICRNIKYINKSLFKYRVVENSISHATNFNIFDIHKSMEDVKEFYRSIGKIDEYNKYIVNVEFQNYYGQMTKAKRYKSYKDRRSVYNYFINLIDGLDFSKAYKNEYITKLYKKYKFKKLIKSLLILLKK